MWRAHERSPGRRVSIAGQSLRHVTASCVASTPASVVLKLARLCTTTAGRYDDNDPEWRAHRRAGVFP